MGPDVNKARIVAWLAWSLNLLLAVFAAYLLVTTGGVDVGIEPETPSQRWLELVFVAGSTTAGAVIIAKHPRNVIGWLFVAVSLTTVVQQLGIGYAAMCSSTDLCLLGLLILADAIWFPSLAIGLGGLFLLFPHGRVPPRWRSVLWWGLVVAGLMGAAIVPFQKDIYHLAGVTNRWWAGENMLLPALEEGAGVAVFLLAATAVVDFFFRARRAHGVSRLQYRWLAFAGVVTVLGGVAAVVGETLALDLGFLFGFGVATVPVAVVVAINRYRLYEIDSIVSRTVTYTLVVGLLGLVVLMLVALSTMFLPSDDPLIVATATLAAAALFNPVRRRVQRVVDRRFNRMRYDAERVVEGFVGSLQVKTDLDEVVDGWVEVIDDTMSPSIVGVWVKQR
jgi:hypothetical protein